MSERWPGELGEVEEREPQDDSEEEPLTHVEDERLEDESRPQEAAPEPEEADDDDAPVLAEAQPEPESDEEPDAEPEPERADQHAGGELDIPDDVDVIEGEATGTRRGVAVVVARFNGEITNRLLEGAFDELAGAGVPREAITVMPVPGAFELPLAAMALAKTRRYACVVALGCVIRGETPHFDYVASEAASGLQLASLETGVPVAFGVLTVDTREQAEARIAKGAEAVRTALEMSDAFSQLRASANAAR